VVASSEQRRTLMSMAPLPTRKMAASAGRSQVRIALDPHHRRRHAPGELDEHQLSRALFVVQLEVCVAKVDGPRHDVALLGEQRFFTARTHTIERGAQVKTMRSSPLTKEATKVASVSPGVNRAGLL
jgi:hypothetical protein